MAFPLLGEIERLINEHGSATILRERLELARDQYEALERTVATLQEDNARLKAEHKRLELNNRELKNQVHDLDKTLSEARGKALTNEEEAIIKLLAHAPHGLVTEQIAASLSMHPTKAAHFLNKLYSSEHVGAAGNYITGQTTYFLHPKGQEYAVTHGFV